jgi:hypothetical protein
MKEALALALGAALAAGAVAFAARPFLRRPGGPDRLEGGGRERIRLEDERDRALAALKELEFDHRTGKISDADYRGLVGPLRREAAAAVRSLDVMMRAAMSTPEPVRVPEPWPPPDEGDLPDPAPTPAPGEPAPGPEEPAPPQHPPAPETRA